MKSFGLLIDWISSQYHQEIWRGVHAFCKTRGINLFTFVTRSAAAPNHWEKMRNQLLELLESGQFDGFLFNTASLGVYSDHQELRNLLSRVSPAPVVSIGNDLEGSYGVMVDNRRGFRQLLRHLYEDHGYRRYAYAGGPLASVDGQDRKAIFLEFLNENGLVIRENHLLAGEFNSAWGQEAVNTLIPGERPDFEVLVCADDEIARGALGALADKNILVPGDLAVTGFDDLPSAGIDALTTTRQPLFEMGWTAAANLGDLVDGKEVPQTIRVATSPVIRQSCGCESPAARVTQLPLGPSQGYTFTELVRHRKEDLIQELVREGLPEEVGLRILEGFLNAWDDQEPGPFLRILKLNLAKTETSSQDPGTLHYPLAVLRRWVIQANHTDSEKLFVENLIHQSRIILTEALHFHADQTETHRFYQHKVLSELNEGLVFSRNFGDQAAVLLSHLPLLGISKFQLTLYEDLAQPMRTARMVLTDQGEVPDGGTLYNPKKLFGPGFVPGPEPWTYVAESLFERNSPLGFILLDSKGEAGLLKVFDQLGERISPGIETIHRIQHLEDQVALRTAELKDALDDLEAYNIKLKEMALRDEMTNLYNRRGFLTLAEHQLRSNFRKSQNLTLFYGDLDRLKTINDTWGHNAGDSAIMTTARLLLETFRAEDIVARFGGDEFVVLAPGCSPTDAMILAGRLDQAFAQYDGGRYSISLGWISIDPKVNKSLADWMKEADETLYRAKEVKRDRKTP